MAWDYDPALPTDKDKVRFYLQDVEEEEPFLQDEEIEHLLELYMPRFDSQMLVAAVAAEVLSNRFAREMTVSGDGVSIDSASLQKRFDEVAKNLRDQYKQLATTDTFLHDFSGVLAHGFDDSLAPLNFGLGMHDNPSGGSQFQGRPGRPYSELEEYP